MLLLYAKIKEYRKSFYIPCWDSGGTLLGTPPLIVFRHTWSSSVSAVNPSKHETLNQWLGNVGPTSRTAAQHWPNIGSIVSAVNSQLSMLCLTVCDRDNLALFVCPSIWGRWPSAGLIVGQRRRRWSNIKPALGERLVFVGWRHWDKVKWARVAIILLFFKHGHTMCYLANILPSCL